MIIISNHFLSRIHLNDKFQTGTAEEGTCLLLWFYVLFILFIVFLHTLVGVKAVEDGWMLLLDSKFQNDKVSLCSSKKSGF